MSLGDWYEPPDDDLGERAAEAGYLDPDQVDQLKKLLKHIDVPTDHSKGMAAFVLIEDILHNPVVVEGSDYAIRLTWARTKLTVT